MDESAQIKIFFKDGYYITNGLKNIIDIEIRVIKKIREENNIIR